MADPGRRILSRRQLVAACAGGSLIGSAWAIAFRESASSDASPAVTVARDFAAIALLVEHNGSRILALDSPDAVKCQQLTEQVAGMTRQRIDVLLATSTTFDALPSGFLGRWKIAHTFALPDRPAPASGSLAGRSLTIGDLSVHCGALPDQWWKQQAPVNTVSWYLTVAFGLARVSLTSDGTALARAPREPDCVNVLVCGDEEAILPQIGTAIAILALPAEADALEEVVAEAQPRIIRLHRNQPVTFRLDQDGISLPPGY